MKLARLSLPLVLGLLLLAGTLAGLAQAGGGAYRESVLPGASELEEIHMGADGNVWISDYDAGQVWQINPATGAFKRFHDLPGVLDARPGPGGYVWWLDFFDRWLGRLEIATGEVTTWTLQLNGVWGLAFDEQGRVWVGGYGAPLLIRFDPVSHQRCEFSLSNGSSGYMVAHDGAIWYGQDNTGLGRLNTTSHVNTFWSFGIANLGAWSVGANDALGVWVVDDSFGLLGHLDPDFNTLTTYTSTLLTRETMVLPRGHSVWFTDRAGQVVAFDPALATNSTTIPVTSTTSVPISTCINASAGVTFTVATSTGVLTFDSGTFTSTVENGMTHYALPAGSNPYGLADVNGDLWFVDLDRNTLTILEAFRLRLPLITR